MNSHLDLRFEIGSDDAFDTMEAVLATARRGGLRLAAMSVTPPAGSAHEVRARFDAHDADLFDLFLARMGKLFGVAVLEVL